MTDTFRVSGIIIIVFVMLSSCGPGKSNYKTLHITDSFSTGIPLLSKTYFQFSKTDSVFYVFSDAQGEFYRYDIKNNKLLPTVAFPALRHYKFRYSFCGSSLFVLKKDSNDMEMYDVATKSLLNRFFLRDSTVSIYALFSDFYVDKDLNTSLYTLPNLSITDTEEARKYFSSSVLCSYHLADSSLHLNYNTGKFTGSYREKLCEEYHPCAANVNDSTMAYIFSDSPNIFVASKNSFASHTVYGLKQNELIALYRDSLMYHEYSTACELKDEKYEWLLHDNSAKHFYLVQSHAVKATDTKVLSLWEDKPITIYVIDSSYHDIAQKEFEHFNDYIISTFFCLKGKLYLGKIKNRKLFFECYETTD